MVSHEHKLIFVHIPKCAGTSFEAYFGHFDAMQGRRQRDHRTIRDIEPLSPRALFSMNPGNIGVIARRMRRRMRGGMHPHNMLMPTADQFRSYYKFTIVRNPWHRVRSWYRNVQRYTPHQEHYPNDGFADFVNKYAGKKMIAPYEHWVSDFAGNDKMDLVIRMEDMATGLAQLAKDLGLPAIDLPRENEAKTAAPADADRFTDEMNAIIASRYAGEIARFGYEPPKAAHA